MAAVMLGVELMESHAVVVVTGHAGSRSTWVGGEIKTAENLNRQIVKIEARKYRMYMAQRSSYVPASRARTPGSCRKKRLPTASPRIGHGWSGCGP